MTRSHSSAVILEPLDRDCTTSSNGLRIADDVIPYSTNPTTVIRQLRADGMTWLECGVYQHIADRQWNKDGQCWQGNAAIANDLGITSGTVSKAINKLKKAAYLSVWWSNTGRRMRVRTRGVARTNQGGSAYAPPYKEDNTKKTTQQVCCFSEKHRIQFGGDLDTWLKKFGSERLEQALKCFDSAKVVDNPTGFVKDALRHRWKPRKAEETKFPENSFDHTKIIANYIQTDPSHKAKVDELLIEGVPEGRVAYKIWSGKI